MEEYRLTVVRPRTRRHRIDTPRPPTTVPRDLLSRPRRNSPTPNLWSPTALRRGDGGRDMGVRGQ